MLHKRFAKVLFVLAVCMLTAFSSVPSAALAASSGVETEKPIKNAILISWDGVQREHLRELLEAGKLPNLKALIDEGTIVEIDVTHKTDTKAGHAEMLTGYGPEVTGVHSNTVYQPIPKGYTIFERLEEALGSDNIATIMITGKAAHLGSRGPEPGKTAQLRLRDLGSRLKPGKLDEFRTEVLARLKKVFGDDKVGRAIIWYMVNSPREAGRELPLQLRRPPADLGKPQVGSEKPLLRLRRQLAAAGLLGGRPGEPYFNAKSAIDLTYLDKARPADEVGQLALESLDKYGKGRFFAFYHFSDPDHAGHKYGENSSEYSDAIVTADSWLGKLVEKLKELGIYEETRIYVTSDHGFDEGKTSHAFAPYVFLATNDSAIKRRGDQRDIVPTILTRMGVDISNFTPPLLGRLLTEPEKAW